MKHVLLSILIAFGLVLSYHTAHAAPVPGDPASASLEATLISRAEQGETVYVTYLLQAPVYPDAVAVEGEIKDVTAQYERASGWRVTVRAMLDRCTGILRVTTGTVVQTLIEQRCVMVPFIARAEQR